MINLSLSLSLSGMETNDLPVTDIYEKVMELKYHDGFPSRAELTCPVFRQDKFRYLAALPNNFTLPTIKIEMSKDMNMDAVAVQVER